MMFVPVAAPRSRGRVPSPNVMVTLRIAVPLLAAGTAPIVNVVTPSAVGFGLGVTDTVGWGRGDTATAAEPAGPAPAFPLTEPSAPTAAVTVAGCVVVRAVFALPS